jgi:selenide,water dikinase
LSLPPGKALVQTVDFFTPVVNDPFKFGQIAAANALSDVYAMGGEPYACMNVVCFPVKCMPLDVLRDVLRGGLSKIAEAGAAMAGGHSVEDAELKYGLSVTGLVEPEGFATNRGLRAGDVLILTKAVGTGVLATAVKRNLPGSERLEDVIWASAARLNAGPGAVIRRFGLRAATDITGFGLGGHALEMSKASGLAVAIEAGAVPLLPGALELARQGVLPGGSRANRQYFSGSVESEAAVDPVLLDLIFDAQTSGGLLLAAPEGLAAQVRHALDQAGDLAATVGRVLQTPAPQGFLIIR